MSVIETVKGKNPMTTPPWTPGQPPPVYPGQPAVPQPVMPGTMPTAVPQQPAAAPVTEHVQWHPQPSQGGYPPRDVCPAPAGYPPQPVIPLPTLVGARDVYAGSYINEYGTHLMEVTECKIFQKDGKNLAIVVWQVIETDSACVMLGEVKNTVWNFNDPNGYGQADIAHFVKSTMDQLGTEVTDANVDQYRDRVLQTVPSPAVGMRWKIFAYNKPKKDGTDFTKCDFTLVPAGTVLGLQPTLAPLQPTTPAPTAAPDGWPSHLTYPGK